MDQRIFGGRYEAEHFIGVPGRLEAYSGVDATSRARVAILVARAADQAQVSEWTQRAQAASAFQHPDVARIIDWGRDGESDFFAIQEWATGTDLATIVSREGTIAADRVARFGEQAAAALSAAHANGVVHGNLRPEEIVMADERTMVTGLGAPGSAGAWQPAADATPAAAWYLSPEQCAGQPAAAASDIYSLGAVLYHLATGRVPFDGPDAVTVCSQHQNAPVESPRRVNPYIPSSLEAVIMRAMAKNPGSRYGSAEEMRQALETAAAGEPQTAPTEVMPAVAMTMPKKRRVWPWILAAVIILLLLGGAFAAWWLGYLGGVQVPDLTGQTPLEASKTLEDAGLSLGKVTAAASYPGTAKKGTVFEQDPSAGGPARKNSAVNVTLAGGETEKVPDVVGQGESEAIANLQAAGFTLAPVERKNDKADAGTVIAQTPPADSNELKGSAITITVSKGPKTADVPNVLGKTEAQATDALSNAGFKVKVQQIQAADVVAGNVVNQIPAAGTKAIEGSEVTLLVSSGAPKPKQVTVPNVVGNDQNTALKTLQDANLKVQIQTVTVTDAAQKGKVQKQDPGANSTVDEGTTVTIQVGQ